MAELEEELQQQLAEQQEAVQVSFVPAWLPLRGCQLHKPVSLGLLCVQHTRHEPTT